MENPDNDRYRLDVSRQSRLPDPRLRLFFSIDIVGSTAYKQRAVLPGKAGARRDSEKKREKNTLHWLQAFTSFYWSIERRVAEEWGRFPESLDNGRDPGKGPRPAIRGSSPPRGRA